MASHVLSHFIPIISVDFILTLAVYDAIQAYCVARMFSFTLNWQKRRHEVKNDGKEEKKGTRSGRKIWNKCKKIIIHEPIRNYIKLSHKYYLRIKFDSVGLCECQHRQQAVTLVLVFC